jgi:hypothetical protein
MSRFRGFTAFQLSVRSFIVVSFIIAFWNDFKLAAIGFWNLLIKFLPPAPETSAAMVKVTTGLMLLTAIYLVLIFWLTHFVLPITKSDQSFPGFWRMFLHGISWRRLHGPAVFVRNGEVQGEQAEFRKTHPGVAFLDLRSAMTLDKLHHSEDEELSDDPLNSPPKVRFSRVQSGAAYAAQVRTVGPGLVFTKSHESITGSVDLRAQVRARPKVIADTRDGIRVSTTVIAVFTVGQPPEIVDVCLGGEKMDQAFIIEWDNTAPANTKRFSKLTQRLGPEDEAQVLNFIHTTPRPSSVKTDCPPEKFPFTFDEKRAEQAVYSIANRNDPDQTGVKKWSDWTTDVAAEKFRILISEYPYLSLYVDPTEKDDKKTLHAEVRKEGVLAFRVVKQLNGMPPVDGKTYPTDQLIFFPAQTFKGPAVLRGRGIKVIYVGFGELEPMDPRVREQLRDSWLSSKKKEEVLKVADYELEATRIINHARIRTQQNMNYHLAKLLEQHEYPREALAMLVYQELEAAAANPETRKLLPENTLNMMNDIGQLLMQNQRDENGFGAERKFIPPEEGE